MQLNRLHNHLSEHQQKLGPDYLRSLAKSLGGHRTPFAWRHCITASDPQSLLASLKHEINPVRAALPPCIAFVFTGQGAQWAQMGQDLMVYPTYAAQIEAADQQMRNLGSSWSLKGMWYYKTWPMRDTECTDQLPDELSKDQKTSRINSAYISQPACTAIQLALVGLLNSWGIRPAAVVSRFR